MPHRFRSASLEAGPLSLVEIAALRGFGALRPMQAANGWEEWLHPDFRRNLAALGSRQEPILSRAFAAFSQRGAYPLAQRSADVPWHDIAAHLNDTVVKRVIEHDLRVGERGRKRDRQLLEQVLRMACRYIGQSPSPAMLAEEARRSLGLTIVRRSESEIAPLWIPVCIV
jgi:hypothetical protein